LPHIAQAGDQRFDFIAFSEQMRREILLLEITIASKSGGAELGDQAHSLEKMIDARMRRTPGSGWRRSNTPPHQVAPFQLSGGTTGVPKIIPRFK
jgi:non-ribosomal peptide synthetase component E (peptide arylation enzyme)